MTKQVPQSFPLVTWSKQLSMVSVAPQPDLFPLIKLCSSERPKLDTVLQTEPPEHEIKGDNQLHHLADFTLTQPGMWLAYIAVSVHHWRVPFSDSFSPAPVTPFALEELVWL